MSALYDPTRIFPVVEQPHLPGPRFGLNDNGESNSEALVAEPITDRRLADHHPRAAARIFIGRLLRNALRDALSRYHGTRTRTDTVDQLRDPTNEEAGAITNRLVQEPQLAEAFRRIATLRGQLLWLENLDKRDGVEPRPGAQGHTYPGISLGPALNLPFRPVGIR
jgi:hypothetical protein